MSNGLLKDAYRLYQKSLLSHDFNVLLSASFFIEYLKKLYPNNSEVDSLYQNISHLISTKERKRKNEKLFVYERQKFIDDNRSFLDEYVPNIHVNKQLVSLENYDYNFLMNLIYNFFQNLSSDLLNIFLDLLKEERILIRNYNINIDFMNLDSDIPNGFVLPILFMKDKYLVFINNFQGIDGALTLVHEIGHILYFKYNNIRNEKLYSSKDEIKFEIIPRTLELLFINYLYEIGFKEQAENLYEFFSQGLETDYLPYNDFARYEYSMANFVSMQCIDALIEKKITLKEFCKVIYNTPYWVILKETKEFFQRKNTKILR